MTLFESNLWIQLMTTIGEITFFLILGMLLAAIALAIIVTASITRGKSYLPQILIPGLVLLEGLVKAFCKLLGLDDRDLVTFFITLRNTMNTKAFSETPVNQRAVFLPQCLRSAQCPANLTPEGLKCRNCGRCAVGENTAWLEGLGYRVFIVPGSTFIKRMVKKYHPQAIIGVGCLTEVKDGIDMCDKIGITPMGVVNLKDGCVETIADWAAVRDVALLGLERVSGPVDLHGPSE
ncbi:MULTISPECIES: DUF116 domain-containing protein [Methanoculleus]|jgi:hypothetical protein|uniref:DUF116 domain-containing protein n=1 Tax=Methanoculleus thermophilus TaxID=2200 RepID=A0A1G9ALS5_9EURY|nr:MULTISPECIES: DUF116 domain-containing protein [Methanoculleus]NLN09058.1 DUF116 domain-containing protein [Methanoculleus thermophilus]SDK28257.1 hypothetical protein SAMN04488571_106135 [Methanoculleus thermophilus]HQD25064.1 DUF116 domain-containing protein [Methanoculleus thermophilus]